MEQVQNLEDYCLKCRYNVPPRFVGGEISLEQARRQCAYCKFGKSGIYKFDIVYALWQSLGKLSDGQSTKPRATGKKATYMKRYGVAVQRLQSEGMSQRQIADILGISRTSVMKIMKCLRSDTSLFHQVNPTNDPDNE